ncbi:aerobic-type carbon monoxide dehydrogenase small subunit (CoxS/CutS family) [Streptacidiphilus sp. MAP12-20]
MTDYLTASLGFGAEDSPRASYTLRVNGLERPVNDAWIGESLLYVLRERLGLAGAKGGCEQGECGACSVQVDGQLTAACLVPAALAAGVEIRTVEGLAEDGVPSDVQQALADSGAVQCGYCAPGLAMAVHDLLERNHHPSELEARQALCGNLCRCTGYQGALAAVRAVAGTRTDAAEEDGESADSSPAGVGYFGEGPVDGLIEATSPVEELVPLPIPVLDETTDELLDDDGETELPVYVDVPPQHGGGYGYATPHDPGYPDGSSGYGDQGYGGHDGHGQDGSGYGQGPYPGGPFGGRFPGQADGPGTRSAAGSVQLPDPAPAGAEATGSLLVGAPPMQDQAGPQVPDAERTGEVRLGPALGAGFRAQSAAAAARLRADTPPADPQPPTTGPTAFAGLGAETTGSFRVAVLPPDSGVGSDADAFGADTTGSFHVGGLWAEGHAAGPGADATGSFQVGALREDHFAHGGAFGADVTGSFEVGALRGEGYADVTGSFQVEAIAEGHAEAGGYHYGAPPGGGYGEPAMSLDPTTGVYVLPHQHGQEAGS